MAHQVDGRKLGRPTDHRLALFRNQVTDLLRYERIVTTEAKAKEVRGLAEKMITLAKKGAPCCSAGRTWRSTTAPLRQRRTLHA